MFLCKRSTKSSDEFNRALTAKKNRQMAKAFAAVPFPERVIFVPHCMRNIEKCKAKEAGSHYICAECGACKIGPISKKAKELGYKALIIAKGGKAVEKLTGELKPRAIIGVACFFEGVQGLELAKKYKIPVQFVPLTKDGCAGTDVDLAETLVVLELKEDRP